MGLETSFLESCFPARSQSIKSLVDFECGASGARIRLICRRFVTRAVSRELARPSRRGGRSYLALISISLSRQIHVADTVLKGSYCTNTGRVSDFAEALPSPGIEDKTSVCFVQESPSMNTSKVERRRKREIFKARSSLTCAFASRIRSFYLFDTARHSHDCLIIHSRQLDVTAFILRAS